MPRIRVEWLEGRTQEQREELARLLTDAVVKVAGVKPGAVTVIFQENPPNLMAKGGKIVSKYGL